MAHLLSRRPRAVLALAAALVVGIAGCSTNDAAPVAGNAPAPVAVQVAAVKTGPIRSVLTYSGAIQSSQQVNLTPRTAGQIVGVYADVGATVRTGQRLASIDPGTLGAQVQQAQANLDAARARLATITTGSRAVDIAAAQSAYDAAQARLNQLLAPSASDRAAADAAVTAAEVALNNAGAAERNTKATLLSVVTIYCNTWPTFGLPCGDIVLPLAPDTILSVESSLQTRAGDPMAENGIRANAVLSANAAYVAALGAVPGARDALTAARAKREALLRPSSADVFAARSAVDQARAALENRQNPYTESDLNGARAAVAQAEAALAITRTMLDQTDVLAPFDGVISQKLLDVGSSASPATPIFVISAKAVEVHLTVEEARVGLVRPDLAAELSVAAFPGRTFAAKVASVAPTGDPRAHTFDVKVHAEDPGLQLKPGMFAQVTMVTAQKASALLVPSNAIVQLPKGSAVVVVVDGKAVFRPVQLGVSDQSSTEVTEGLKTGDEIVVVGQNAVREGQAVSVGSGQPAKVGTAAPTATASP